MKAELKAISFFEYGYFDLSEKLRHELELKIEELYTQNRFNHYVNNKIAGFENAAKSDFLCAYLLSKAPNDYMLSGELLQGIKTWFNMYYDDRLSVIDKFRTYCQNVMPPENVNQKPLVTIAFCRFLISELLVILAESRWQDLIRHADRYRKVLYN